jgi:hypothetical protein
MALKVQTLFDRARTILQDRGAVARWPLTELLDWVNEGAQRICAAKPNANTAITDLALVTGARQSLPSSATNIARVISGASGGAERAVTAVSRKSLEAFCPGWMDPAIVSATAIPDHVIYDIANPDIFWVYPPSLGGGALTVDLCLNPTPIAAPLVNPDQLASYSMDIPLNDEFQGALLDYLLYRAFSKDANMPNMQGRAAQHFAAFQVAIGEKVQRDMMMNPATQNAMPKS